MSLDILLLIGILLAKAQERRGGGSIFTPTPTPVPDTTVVTRTPGGGVVTTLPEILITASPPGPAQAAQANQARANEAAAEARAAAQRGDTVTASQKAQEATVHQKAANSAAKAAQTAPAWPQVVPAGLPPFPGPGWHPASPVTGAMSSRAFQLLPQLWQHGAGTWKTEKTGDRWVTYRATDMGAGKRGVVAFTTSAQASPAAAAAPVQQASMTSPSRPSQIVPASTPASSGMPTLKLTTPRMQGPSVVWLQQKLGLVADGVFGTGTQAGVINYQSAHGLLADGVVGPKTWASLGVGQQAAA